MVTWCNHGGVGCQVPQPIGVHHHGDIPDPAEHTLVPPQPRAQQHHVEPWQSLIDLLYRILCV